MATHGGAADSYYNTGPDQPQMQYPPQTSNDNGRGFQGNTEPKYDQAPPNYDQNFQNSATPAVGNEKQDFNQVFKIEKPKFNDIWAGILVGNS